MSTDRAAEHGERVDPVDDPALNGQDADRPRSIYMRVAGGDSWYIEPRHDCGPVG